MSRPWQVEILSGRPMATDDTAAPLMFGTTSIAVGGEKSEIYEPIIYGPVVLRGEPDWLLIQVPDAPVPMSDTPGGFYQSYSDVREMVNPRYSIDWTGSITVTGWELDEERRPVFACWRFDPYDNPAENG